MRAVCDSTRLGVIFYNRDNGVLNESVPEQFCDRCPNVIGPKNGHGEIELMTPTGARLGDRLVYIGGPADYHRREPRGYRDDPAALL